MIKGNDVHNLGHTGNGGWDHGFGAGEGFAWGAPNPYGMGPITQNESGDSDVAHNGRIGMIQGHKGGFGNGFAGWGNAGTGDMLDTDQEIGDGEFEPHHPLVVKPGRGHFHHNHNHGVGYGFNAGYKSAVPKKVLQDIHEAVEAEVSDISVDSTKLKNTTTTETTTAVVDESTAKDDIQDVESISSKNIRENEPDIGKNNLHNKLDNESVATVERSTAAPVKKSLYDKTNFIVRSSASNEPSTRA